MRNKVWNEITYPFAKVIRCTVCSFVSVIDPLEWAWEIDDEDDNSNFKPSKKCYYLSFSNLAAIRETDTHPKGRRDPELECSPIGAAGISDSWNLQERLINHAWSQVRPCNLVHFRMSTREGIPFIWKCSYLKEWLNFFKYFTGRTPVSWMPRKCHSKIYCESLLQFQLYTESAISYIFVTL